MVCEEGYGRTRYKVARIILSAGVLIGPNALRKVVLRFAVRGSDDHSALHVIADQLRAPLHHVRRVCHRLRQRLSHVHPARSKCFAKAPSLSRIRKIAEVAGFMQFSSIGTIDLRMSGPSTR